MLYHPVAPERPEPMLTFSSGPPSFKLRTSGTEDSEQTDRLAGKPSSAVVRSTAAISST